MLTILKTSGWAVFLILFFNITGVGTGFCVGPAEACPGLESNIDTVMELYQQMVTAKSEKEKNKIRTIYQKKRRDAVDYVYVYCRYSQLPAFIAGLEHDAVLWLLQSHFRNRFLGANNVGTLIEELNDAVTITGHRLTRVKKKLSDKKREAKSLSKQYCLKEKQEPALTLNEEVETVLGNEFWEQTVSPLVGE